jgi:mediator of RNA polymerase II transcription subunit 7
MGFLIFGVQYPQRILQMNRQDLTTAFPLPPAHFKTFTDEAWADFTSRDSSFSGNPYFIPPVPIDGKYIVFGREEQLRFTLPTLEELQIEPLDFESNENADKKQVLKTINRQLKSTFIDLLDTLINNPSNVYLFNDSPWKKQTS